MAAKKGNKNAKGNKGATYWGKDNREKAAKLKGLVMNWATKVMEGDDDKAKKEIVLKILPACIPTVIEGDDDSTLIVKVINYARDNITVPVSTEKLSTGLPVSATEVQSGSLEQEGWEVKDSAKPTDK